MARHNRLVAFAAALALVTAFVILGCGLKADPAPRRIQSQMPMTIAWLQKETRGTLNLWQIAEPSSPMTRLPIFASGWETATKNLSVCLSGKHGSTI